MNSIMNYVFSAAAAESKPEPPPRPSDVSVVVTIGNEMFVYKLSKIKNLTQNQLLSWRDDLMIHSAQSFSVEDVNDANTLLDEIDRRLKTFTT